MLTEEVGRRGWSWPQFSFCWTLHTRAQCFKSSTHVYQSDLQEAKANVKVKTHWHNMSIIVRWNQSARGRFDLIRLSLKAFDRASGAVMATVQCRTFEDEPTFRLFFQKLIPKGDQQKEGNNWDTQPLLGPSLCDSCVFHINVELSKNIHIRLSQILTSASKHHCPEWVTGVFLSTLSLSANAFKWIRWISVLQPADIEQGRNICFSGSQEGHLPFRIRLNEIHLFLTTQWSLILMQFFHQLHWSMFDFGWHQFRTLLEALHKVALVNRWRQRVAYQFNEIKQVLPWPNEMVHLRTKSFIFMFFFFPDCNCATKCADFSSATSEKITDTTTQFRPQAEWLAHSLWNFVTLCTMATRKDLGTFPVSPGKIGDKAHCCSDRHEQHQLICASLNEIHLFLCMQRGLDSDAILPPASLEHVWFQPASISNPIRSFILSAPGNTHWILSVHIRLTRNLLPDQKL